MIFRRFTVYVYEPFEGFPFLFEETISMHNVNKPTVKAAGSDRDSNQMEIIWFGWIFMQCRDPVYIFCI